jgi:hypothetical protein
MIDGISEVCFLVMNHRIMVSTGPDLRVLLHDLRLTLEVTS